jgi:assimilatory nitrate reductase catalytic subunit
VAQIPSESTEIIERFGPHRSVATAPRLDTGTVPDRAVRTHCCFCGQQCGMQLLVKDDQVIGIEPWMEFPFNQGKLCPKGVKRYLQGAHPDRLLQAHERDPGAAGGFRAVPYEQAIARVATEIGRIQEQHGRDAFAVLSGASLTTEKTYLMGKFARMCLRTSNIDYNGRLCMVSAAAGNKKSFGIDRAANPWSDILEAEVVWISGANVAECAPITTDYVWQARENGAKVIVVDPRITPIARTCDLFLPVKPGRDAALFNGILHLMIEQGWIDREFIARSTVGFEALTEHVAPWTPRRTAEVTGHRRAGPSARPPSGGERPRRASSCTRGASSTRATACRTCWARSTSCSRRVGSAARAAATRRSTVTGQRTGGASTARSATRLPGERGHRQPRSTARTWRGCGNRDGDCPVRGSTATRSPQGGSR